MNGTGGNDGMSDTLQGVWAEIRDYVAYFDSEAAQRMDGALRAVASRPGGRAPSVADLTLAADLLVRLTNGHPVHANLDDVRALAARLRAAALAALPQLEKPMDNFHESFDARDWATAFVATVRERPSLATDEGTMVAWFANAIMRGYDEHARRAALAPPEDNSNG